MKFEVTINGTQTDSIEAASPKAAVDAAREAHKPPERGGDFDIVVSAASPWVDSAGDTQPAGPVSEFSVRHEPAEHLRETVETEAREREQQEIHEAYVAKIRADVLAELEAAGVNVPGSVKVST